MAQADGSIRRLIAYHVPHGRSCAYKQNEATAGTVTWTTITTDPTTGAVTQVAATYTLAFPAGQVSGSFLAPVCALDGCPPRPSTSSCVDG